MAQVIRVNSVKPHPNADYLDVVPLLSGGNCVVGRNEFFIGDWAIYIPAGSVLPDDGYFSFADQSQHWGNCLPGEPNLDKGTRTVRPRTIRGVDSIGILIPFQKLLDWHRPVEPISLSALDLAMTGYNVGGCLGIESQCGTLVMGSGSRSITAEILNSTGEVVGLFSGGRLTFVKEGSTLVPAIGSGDDQVVFQDAPSVTSMLQEVTAAADRLQSELIKAQMENSVESELRETKAALDDARSVIDQQALVEAGHLADLNRLRAVIEMRYGGSARLAINRAIDLIEEGSSLERANTRDLLRITEVIDKYHTREDNEGAIDAAIRLLTPAPEEPMPPDELQRCIDAQQEVIDQIKNQQFLFESVSRAFRGKDGAGWAKVYCAAWRSAVMQAGQAIREFYPGDERVAQDFIYNMRHRMLQRLEGATQGISTLAAAERVR
jgi:hypothetical protein